MRIKRYKLFNILSVVFLFNIPTGLILWDFTHIEILFFIEVLGLSLILGYLMPFRKKLPIKNDIPLVRGYLYFLWVSILIAVFLKIMAVGIPGERFFGRAYEHAFMSSYPILTKLYLFAPIISAGLVVLEEKKLLSMFIFVTSVVIIFLPGVKGNVFLFIYIIIFFQLLETKRVFKVVTFVVVLAPLITFMLFYISHFVIRTGSSADSFIEILIAVADKIFLYFVPNFQNLALAIEKSEIFQYGAVFMFPIVETVTLGTVRTTGEGQIWYFVDPSLKAGTFARDFWQDWGIMAPFFTFLLGVLYSWVSSLVDGDSKINKLLLSILSFPFAFVFFYNEFSRNQIIFGVLLVVLVVQSARRVRL